MGKNGDLSDFERGMVVGARRAGLSISKTADLLGFSRTTIGFTENGPKKRKYPVSGSCVNSNNHSLQPRHVEPWSRWATAAEDHIGCHSCQLRTGNGAYNSHRLTKIGQWKIGKTLLGLMSLDFCCNIRMVGSEFGIKNMKAWIHLALSQRFRLLVVV